MLVCLSIMIGSDTHTVVRKKTKWDFLPVKGMGFQDETWSEAREIISVSVICVPDDDDPYLEVALSPDKSEPLAVLQEQVYKLHGWK